MKKGQFGVTERIPETVFLAIFFIFAAFGLANAVTEQSQVEIVSDEFDANLFIRKLYFSQECFAYEGELRVHVWELDLSKLKDETLINCLGDDYLVKITFDTLDLELYNNKVEFDNLEGFCKFSNKYLCKEPRQVFTIKNGNEEFLEIVTMKVIKDVS